MAVWYIQVFYLHLEWQCSCKHKCNAGFMFFGRYSNVWKSCLTLYTGKSGEVIKVGEYVSCSPIINFIIIWMRVKPEYIC